MSAFFGVVAVFLFGMVAGTVLTVWQASRPRGYEAFNGKRYKLAEFA